MDKLLSTVRYRTIIGEGFTENAAPEAMDTYLSDWRQARARLDARITELEALRAQRAREKAAGEWPPPTR